MEYVYTRFDPRSRDRREREQRARAIYHHLLLLADGDVDRALDLLKRLDARYGLFDDAYTFRDFVAGLEKERLVEKTRGGAGFRMTAGGEIALRRGALERVFRSLKGGGEGDHRAPGTGAGHERTAETRPYAFGDDVAGLDLNASVWNALRRAGPDFDLREQDLAVFETEALASCATVIAIDVSHSMTLYGEDRITPAKQVSLALVELIRTRYPKDALDVILFGDQAVEVPVAKIPYVSNGPYHTNTCDALRLAGRILRRKPQPNKQVFLVTDGKPSALTLEDGTLYKNPFGLDERIVNRTIEEAAHLRRRGVVVTTFMLTDDPYLVSFVEDFTRTNRGRAYYASAERLGSFVLVDYIRNRKGRV